MSAGDALLDLALRANARRIFIVGTAKNVGKTVAMRAVARTAQARGLRVALTSSGRDGEAVDAVDDRVKPRVFLHAGALIATARTLVPAHPAAEIVAATNWPTAAGDVTLLRLRRAAYVELAGPASASALRDCVERFEREDAQLTIVDGALDRVAPLAAGADAVIVAAGAAQSRTMEDAVIEAQALVRRLRVRPVDASKDFVKLEGALTPLRAANIIASREPRQIVVGDPTQIVASGRAAIGLMDRLDVRCERPLNVIAVTAASIGSDRYFEPRSFARALCAATQLPVFDVYADAQVRAA